MKAAREEIKVEEIYATKYDDNHYYRCKVIANTYFFKENTQIIQVISVTYFIIMFPICTQCSCF